MDRILKKKKWNARRFAILFSVIAIIILIGFSYLNTTGRRKLNVERDRLSIFEVKEDVFQEYIPVNGTILPIRTIYLDASVGGIVEEKYVEDPRIGCLI